MIASRDDFLPAEVPPVVNLQFEPKRAYEVKSHSTAVCATLLPNLPILEKLRPLPFISTEELFKQATLQKQL